MARPTGTINMNLVNEKGEISSITTTSGLAWKIPGRAGDSPIVGAGQYTDNEIGAAGSTGLGEANIMVCGGFLTVEHMRQGMKPDRCLSGDAQAAGGHDPAALLDPRAGRPFRSVLCGQQGRRLRLRGDVPDDRTPSAMKQRGAGAGWRALL